MTAATVWPTRRLWTREEYHKAAEAGIFRPNERLELIEGEVLQKMSPQSDPHASGIVLTAEVMRDIFAIGFHVREEKPMVLNDRTEPEPDIVVVRGTPRQTPNHPTPANAVLVIEVSESTLRYDQTTKAASYARSGIADYWLLNLRARQLEVRRDPGLISENQWGYRSLQIIHEDGQISTLAAPDAVINVADLLPTLLPTSPNISIPTADGQNAETVDTTEG